LSEVLVINHRLLEEATQGLNTYLFTFSKIKQLICEDGCRGLGVFFHTRIGKIVVFFPESQEYSVAVYATGEFKNGPQSYGEFQLAVEEILKVLYQRVIALTKPKIA